MLAIAADITHAESHNNNMIKTMHKHDLQAQARRCFCCLQSEIFLNLNTHASVTT